MKYGQQMWTIVGTLIAVMMIAGIVISARLRHYAQVVQHDSFLRSISAGAITEIQAGSWPSTTSDRPNDWKEVSQDDMDHLLDILNKTGRLDIGRHDMDQWRSGHGRVRIRYRWDQSTTEYCFSVERLDDLGRVADQAFVRERRTGQGSNEPKSE